MAHSETEIYLHFVWATFGRLPLISADREQAVYACIEQEARRLGCDVLAVGGMPDHVHLAVKFPTTLAAGKLMQQVKGVSSKFVSDEFGAAARLSGELFRWQSGYSVFSISRSHKARVLAYIANQKQHHAENTIWETCEMKANDPHEPDAHE